MAHAARIPRFNLSRRYLRLGSGLVLFVYVTSHLVNHALGLVSLAFAETGLRIAVGIWHSWPGTGLLYGAAAAHLVHGGRLFLECAEPVEDVIGVDRLDGGKVGVAHLAQHDRRGSFPCGGVAHAQSLRVAVSAAACMNRVSACASRAKPPCGLMTFSSI